MASINPSQTMASGHVAANDGSEDGFTGSGPSPSRSQAPTSTSLFSLSLPTSEASRTFSALSVRAGDELDELAETQADESVQDAASTSKAGEVPDLSGLGPAPLRRNQACLSCRKRKLRCDAARPVCATCARSRAAAAAANHPAPIPPGDCVYDDVLPAGRRHAESAKAKALDGKAGTPGPRKSSGSGTVVSAAGVPTPVKLKAVKEEYPERPTAPATSPIRALASNNPTLDSTSPESSLSVATSAPRAQKRKKRDDGTAQVANGGNAVASGSTPAGPTVTATSGANGSNASSSGQSLEQRMREFQLEDRIYHLEMLLVQSMNRNEQMQAHISTVQSGQNGPGAGPFSAQSTSAFNAATLASAGIPSAACAFSGSKLPQATASTSTSTQPPVANDLSSMLLDAGALPHSAANTSDFARAFSLSAATPAQSDEYATMVSPSASSSYPQFSTHEDSTTSVAGSGMNFSSSNAGAALPGMQFASPSATSVSNGFAHSLHPNAASLLSVESRIASEINTNPQTPGGSNVPPPDPFLELLWSGWPADLPSPDTLHHLAEIFFAKSPLRGMIHRASFMAGLMLPPRHPRRPHEALLHAILAVAAPMSPHFKSKRSNPLAAGVCSPRQAPRAMGTYSDPEYVVPMVGDPHRRQANLDPSQLSFADFHLSQGRLKIEVSMRTSTRNPIYWLQAAVLGAHLLWTDARFVEGFMLSGVVSRSAAPVGLLKLQSRHTAEPQIPASLLAPPSSATEEHERRALMWYVYLNDIYQSGAGLYWEPVIDDAAVQTSLPVPTMQWQAGIDPPPNHQTLTSPDLFTNNHMDDFVLHIKSAIILKRVQLFISRNNITMFTTKRPNGYRALDNTINEFLASFTGSHHLEFGPDVTMDRLLAYNNVLLATIMLHENFVSLSDRTSYSNIRTEQATKAVLQTIYELLASSFDFNLLHPFIYMSWTIAARMICRELTWQRIFGDAKVALEVSQALDTVIEALRRAGDKHLVAGRSALLLDRFRQGHWSEEMLSGSIFIDGVLPGEGEDPPEQRPPKVTAPTKPGQPVHYYPLTGRGMDKSNAGAGVGSQQASAGPSMGTGPNGSSSSAVTLDSSSGSNDAGGTTNQPAPFDISQLAAAATTLFSSWMPQVNNDPMRSSADPFINGTGGAGGASGTNVGGTGSGNGSNTGLSGMGTGMGTSLSSMGLGGLGSHMLADGSGASGPSLMHMSPAAGNTAPSTPWSLMNILAPEQEGLD
ncbi:hypothetical protein V8E36_005797 [Tilletia maclaganii]